MNRRAVVIPLVALLVVVACTAVYFFVLARPAYRTVVLVDTSEPGTGLAQIGDAVKSVAGNSGDADALSVRRFGGECDSPDTAEIAGNREQVGGAVGALSPSGKATMVDGVLAAIDDFSGLPHRRGSVHNRIVVISTTGVDACSDDPAAARRSVDDRLSEAGLELDIRVVGFQVPSEQKDALALFASDATFADTADDLVVVLDRLVIPNSPDAASLSVEPKPEPSYAFLAAGRLGLVRGADVVAETTVEPLFRGDLGYTEDGRFVFAVTTTGIATIDARSGATGLVPCGGCRGAVTAGGSAISWLEGNVLTTLDLADENAGPVQGVTVLPGRVVGESTLIRPLRILEGKNGTSLIAAPDGVSAYGGPENLHLVRPDGQVVEIGEARGNVAVYRTAFSPDGRTLAYVTAAHGGGCEEQAVIVLIDIATGAQRELPVAGEPNIDGSGVADIWYAKDGSLNMIYSSWRCAASGGPRTEETVPLSHWRYGGSAWSRGGDTGYVREVAPGFRMVLDRSGSSSSGWQLFSDVDGVRTKISDDVDAIAVPG